MRIQPITFKDFEGAERTEDFHFNMTPGEILEMELRWNLSGGYSNMLKSIMASQDGQKIMDWFRDLLSRAYGVRATDGKGFYKDPRESAAFLGGPAYSKLFMKLVGNPDFAAEFVVSVFPTPEEMDEAIKEAKADVKPATQPQDYKPSAREVFEQAKPVDPELEEFRRWKEQQAASSVGRDSPLTRREAREQQ